jgi:hypothetical protein
MRVTRMTERASRAACGPPRSDEGGEAVSTQNLLKMLAGLAAIGAATTLVFADPARVAALSAVALVAVALVLQATARRTHGPRQQRG